MRNKNKIKWKEEEDEDTYCHLLDWHEVSTLSYALKDLGELRVDECIIWNTQTQLSSSELDRHAGPEAKAGRTDNKLSFPKACNAAVNYGYTTAAFILPVWFVALRCPESCHTRHEAHREYGFIALTKQYRRSVHFPTYNFTVQLTCVKPDWTAKAEESYRASFKIASRWTVFWIGGKGYNGWKHNHLHSCSDR